MSLYNTICSIVNDGLLEQLSSIVNESCSAVPMLATALDDGLWTGIKYQEIYSPSQFLWW